MGLHDAAKHGRRDAVAALIAAGADVNARDREGWTPLFGAVLEGHAEVVRDLIAAGARVNVRDRGKATPLSHAAYGANVNILEALLRAGARVGPGDLGHVAFSGNLEATRLLLEACRVQHVTPAPGTLSTAVLGRSVAVVKLLLDAGFDPNAGGEREMPALIVAQIAAYQGSDELVRLLLDAGADVNARDFDGNSALSHAVICSAPGVVRLLLERGADTEDRMKGDRAGQTPLIHAAGYGLISQLGSWCKDPERRARSEKAGDETVRLLLQYGADVEARDFKEDRTALLHAAANGREGAARILIDAGADVHSRDELYGRTALMWAATGGHAGIVRRLIEAGADPCAEDLDGDTAAALAARGGNREVVSLLEDFECGPPRSGVLPLRALREAAGAGDAAAILAAERAGADVNARLPGGLTALMVAVEKGHVGAVAALLDAGANPNVRDPKGRTPLIVAIQGRRPEGVRLLLQAGADPDTPGMTIQECGPETPLIAAIGEMSIAMRSARQEVVNGSRDADGLGAEHVAIVRALIAAGVSVGATDERGMRPLWYAFDMGLDDLAELLVEAGAGGEPVGAAYLRAREFAALAGGEPFRQTVRTAAALFDAEPKPLRGRPSHRDFLDPRRGRSFPSGPTLGAAFTVPREQADGLIASHQEGLRRRGAYLFRCEGDFDVSRHELGLLPTSNPFHVIAALCSPGTDWGWVSPGFYIRDLRAIEPTYPFRLIGCEARWLELEFATPIGDVADLARRLFAIPTTLGGPGLPEHPDVEDVIASLRRRPRIHFSWE